MVERDFGLHLSFGKIYLLLTHSTAVGTQTDEEHLSDVVAIDPGVRGRPIRLKVMSLSMVRIQPRSLTSCSRESIEANSTSSWQESD
jgi:hypothetical protein